MKRSNTITAILFGVLTVLMLGLLLWHGEAAVERLEKATAKAETFAEKLNAITENGENAVNEAMDTDHIFVQLFGGMQRFLGKRYVEDAAGMPVARISTGALTFAAVTENVDPSENAAAVKAFADRLAKDGIPLLAVTAPGKLEAGTDQMPVGVPDYGNEICDNYLAALQNMGVDTLDLREAFAARDDYEDLFFVTDHHWKPEGALYACAALMPELSARYGLPMQAAWLQENAYEITTLPGIFLGSQGKRVGTLYAGLDDFTVFTPKEDTYFIYEIPKKDMVREGAFNESLCFPERLEERDPFQCDYYTYYSGGDWAYAHIYNMGNQTGPKIVLIRDSLSCALAPFLATQCSELITYDVRYYKGDLAEAIREEQPDVVLVLYAASTTRSANMFDFSPS